MKVAIVVTHLLGTGHLSRAMTLAQAFIGQGHDVVVISGGMPAPLLARDGITVVQLPPLRSDGTDFSHLLDPAGQPVDTSYLSARQARLCAALSDRPPDILITELFPFGRRILRNEFLALLDTARALPRRLVILASIRDILAPPSKPARATWTEDIVGRYYDAVLVHSDPQTTRLEQSWPVTDRLESYLRYTGYVAPPKAGPHPERAGAGEILVSAGGGGVGTALFETAIAASRLVPGHRWRLLVGGSDAPARIEALTAQAQGTAVVIEPARPDFRQMLCHSAASVSLCGYNTALDLLQAGTPAVFVPFDAGQEVEQTLRADSLASLPAIAVLRSADLTPETLADQLRRVLADGRRDATTLRFDGAAQTVRLAGQLAEARA